MMAEKNSTLVQRGRYVAGGVTEVNTKALEIWERSDFTSDGSDRTYVVEPRFAGRLDQIAQTFLDDSRLWWFVAQYNAILDPYLEIFPGRILRIPTKDRAQTMLTGKLGGIDSTREVPLTNITPIV
jgi:hypothetical protein